MNKIQITFKFVDFFRTAINNFTHTQALLSNK